MKWALRIAAKVILSRLPISYSFWRSLGLFKHGGMDRFEYSYKIFNNHKRNAYPNGLPENSVILELGPGDSVSSAVVSFASAIDRIYLVDVGAFAKTDVDFYRAMAGELATRGLDAPDLSDIRSFDELLEACNAKYLTEGLESLRQIPSDSVDFIWSHSVLEHVRKGDLADVIGELKRITKPGSFSSHNVDYQDHLDHALNNLRFSERAWESKLLSESGFYTNRVPAVAMHRMFADSGFRIRKEEFGRWPSLPTPRKSLHLEFLAYSDDELINRTSYMLLES